jgi:hypothetical protein
MRENDWVVRRLRGVPHLFVEAGVDDVMVRRGDMAVSFQIKSRARLSAREAASLPARGKNRRLLLAVGSLSDAARQQLVERGVSWVERDTGLVHLDAPELYVHLESARPPSEPTEPRLSFRGAGDTIAEALLQHFRDRVFHLREVAESVQLVKSRVSQVLSSMVNAGILDAGGRTRSRVYELRDAARLLDAWTEGARWPPEVSAGLAAWARGPADLYRGLGRLEGAGLRWAIGGVSAANLHAPTLSVLPWPEVWVQADTPVEEIARILEAEPVGPAEIPNLTVWQQGGNPALRLATTPAHSLDEFSGLRTVTRARAYVEARKSGGRAVDVADALREEMGL